MFSRYKKTGDLPGKVTPLAPPVAALATPSAEPADAKIQLQARAGTVAAAEGGADTAATGAREGTFPGISPDFL